MTPEQKEFDAELRKRAGMGRGELTVDQAIAQATAEGFIVDVRGQPDRDAGIVYTIRFHPRPETMFGVSHHAAGDWREPFARCFRQADEQAAQVLAEAADQARRLNPNG